MTPFQSIRGRLQIWYGLIFAVLLAGFGFMAYQLERGRQFRLVDEELQRRAGQLANGLRGGPPRGPGPDQGPFDRPPGMPPGRPRPNRPMDGPGPEPGEFGPRSLDFQVPPHLERLFAETNTNDFYYVVFAPDPERSVLARSSNAPAIVPIPPRLEPPFARIGNAPGEPGMPAPDGQPPPRGMRRGPPKPQMRGIYREVTIRGRPPGEIILAGRSVEKELNDLRRFGWTLTYSGAAVLLLGLAGGWWLAGRAIRPIQDISAAAVKIAAGDLSQRVSVRNSETELGQLANVLNSTFARLEAAFSQQQQFTSDAAHELRTPISVMLTQTQSTLNRERTAAEYRESVETCERAAQRMRRLIESLLELARLDAGQESMKRAPFDLASVSADCAEQIRPLAAARGIAIHTELSATRCLGDSDRIAQVITNLLTNAVHYNQDRGEVRLAARLENTFATLTVFNTGPGIAPEHLPHVFERFYRADPARTASQGRAGLGLAISKAIVDAHGGSLEVSSQPGAGATFTLRLPAGP